MKNIVQLSFLIAAFTLFQFGCDSVTDSNADLTSNTESLNSTVVQSSEEDEIDVVVDDDNTNWDWVNETGEAAFGEFMQGPDDPPIGSGSARFVLETEDDGLALIGVISDGAIPLSEIDKLEYSTYQSVATESQSVSIQFNVDYDGEEDWQGRLVFEPYYSSDLVLNEWQTWDPLTQRGWWATGSPGEEECPIDEPCTLQEILEEFPDVAVRAESDLENAALIIFKAGSEWGEFDGNTDGFILSVNEEELTYSFMGEADEEENDEEENGDEDNGEDENGDSPLTIEDCKDGGWEEFGFRNQGQCIRYVNTGQDSRDDHQNEEGDENGNNEEDNEENGENNDETEENGESPLTIEDCKDGGWEEYGFRNQGQCIRYVNTGQDSRDDHQDEEGDENGNNEEDNEENGENNDETEENGESPLTIEDCKDGGWEAYGFRNQGQCIRYVNTGQDSRGELPDDDENGEEEEEGENGNDSDENGDSEDEENGENGEGSEEEENGDSDENGDNNGSDGETDDNGSEGDDESENGNGETTTAGSGPSSVEDCRDGGWEEYGFRNQGECVRYVRTGK